MTESCRPIPTLQLDRIEFPYMDAQCSVDATSRKLYESVHNKVVLVESGDTPSPRPNPQSKVGSGFFINSGDEVMTNAHVALSGAYTDIITSDGKRYHAHLEDLDDIHDLAKFKVDGLAPDPKRSIDTSTAQKLENGNGLLAFGHPNGYDDVVMSKGSVIDTRSLKNAVGDPKDFPDLLPILELTESNDAKLAADANSYLDADRLQARMKIFHGNSGSLTLDGQGNFAGVVADQVTSSRTLVIPPLDVNSFVDLEKPKFKFDYATEQSGNERLTHIARKDGSSEPPVVLDMPMLIS